MIKRFDTKSDPVLSNIIDSIEDSLKCLKFLEHSNIIEIDTWENIKFKMPHHKEIAQKGFGFCIPNYLEYGVKRIVIINMQNCNRVNFTEREIAAIIYHELGHLLNAPELFPVPTVGYCFINEIKYNKNLEEEIRTGNPIKMEVFADSYANLYGYGDELISTFHKQNQFFDQKIEYFDTRVEKIKSKELFEGNVMPIETNPW